MALQVELFVHGVPAGQKWYGNTDRQDEGYIGTLYNRNDWDVPEFLKVERMSDRVYYTFIKCRNVNAKDGRSGSYFGITLRMNAYYADIQNIYSILKATYKKLCVSLYVSDNGQSVQFLVSDFKEAANQFQEVRKMVLEAIGNFTASEDVVSINAIAATKGSVTAINYDECSDAEARRVLTSAGSLKVSPFYPSHSVSRLKDDYEQRISHLQQEKQTALQQQKADCDNQLTQAQQRQRQAEAQAQKTERDLQSNVRLSQQKIDDLSRQLQDEKNRSNEQERRLRQLEGAGRQIADLQRQLGSEKRKSQDLERQCRTLSQQCQELKNRLRGGGPYPPRKSFLDVIKKWLGVIALLIFLLATLIMGMQLHGVNSKLAAQTDKIDSLSMSHLTESDAGSSLSPSIIVADNLDSIGKGQSVKVAIETQDGQPLSGEWSSDDFDIDDSMADSTSIKLKDSFQGAAATLSYKIDGEEVASHEFRVVKK